MATVGYCQYPTQCYAIHQLNSNVAEMNNKLDSIFGVLTVFFDSWKLSQKEQNVGSARENVAAITVERCSESPEGRLKREDLASFSPKNSPMFQEESEAGNVEEMADGLWTGASGETAGFKVSVEPLEEIVQDTLIGNTERLLEGMISSAPGSMVMEYVEDGPGDQKPSTSTSPRQEFHLSIQNKKYLDYCNHLKQKQEEMEKLEEGEDFGSVKDYEANTKSGKHPMLHCPSRRYPGTVFEYCFKGISKDQSRVYYKCIECEKKKKKNRNLGSIPCLTAKNGRIVTNPDFPRRDHYCEPKPFATVAAIQIDREMRRKVREKTGKKVKKPLFVLETSHLQPKNLNPEFG